MLSWPQVTIVTNNVPAVGAENGETRCQGDMEKADMVDGTKWNLPLFVLNLAAVLKSLEFFLGFCTSRNQRERVLDTPSRGQPQQDLRVPGTVLPLQRPAHVARWVLAHPPIFPHISRSRHRHHHHHVASSVLSNIIQDGYFNEDAKFNLCYCESCHKLRGDEAYYKRGEPPRDYALPFGWCRFALRWADGLPASDGRGTLQCRVLETQRNMVAKVHIHVVMHLLDKCFNFNWRTTWFERKGCTKELISEC